MIFSNLSKYLVNRIIYYVNYYFLTFKATPNNKDSLCCLIFPLRGRLHLLTPLLMRACSFLAVPKPRPVEFIINAMDKKERRLLEAQDIAKAYSEKRLFADSYFYINREEKVGILGPNGCGKTTLLKIIRGKETLDAVEILLSQAARMAYVSQELPQEEKMDFKSLVKDWRLNDQKLISQLLVNLRMDYDRLQVAMGNLSRGKKNEGFNGISHYG